MPRHITEYILYRWRYHIGYLLVALLVGFLLIVAALYVPGGLRAAEMASTVSSSQLSPLALAPEDVIDLPYKLLQLASFTLLGVSIISIKLPSVLLGLLSLVGIILLLRHWFHTNVAIISALIIITTSQFIFSSQDGTPAIMYVFMPTWLLLLAMKVSRQLNQQKRAFWELLLVAALALSLYTPLSIYVIIALASAAILHPHLRYIIGRLSRKKLLIASITGVVVLLPLIIALLQNPAVGLTLLGIPETWPNIALTSWELLQTHIGFILPGADEHAQQVYALPSLLLMTIGVFHLFKRRHTARSYIIVSWMVLLSPIILINPTKTAITFVPVMLLIAAGVDELLHRWYSMFPRNPYARVAGLLPITLLIAGMALTGIERYFYAYRYSPPIVADFSDDLNLLRAELDSEVPTALLASETELPFYQAVAQRSHNLTVIPPTEPAPEDKQFIATRKAFAERDLHSKEPTRIITNGRSNNSDRLYLYKTTEE